MVLNSYFMPTDVKFKVITSLKIKGSYLYVVAVENNKECFQKQVNWTRTMPIKPLAVGLMGIILVQFTQFYFLPRSGSHVNFGNRPGSGACCVIQLGAFFLRIPSWC